MGPLRSRKLLTCFYCGRRSNLRFEGQKLFECSNCEATNWLDEQGEITDPPVTTSSVEREPVQYAIPRSSAFHSPSPTMPLHGTGQEDPVFCSTCLRNQHMLTSSLAQFEWPDDPQSPEYAVREKKYWALRKDLEKRYPQMCAECEPKVEKKLHEASYTAQTDHLRRMMDRTRSQRNEVKKRGMLDMFDLAGKWSWHLGFALAFIWHAVMLFSLLAEAYTPSEDDYWAMTVSNVFRWGSFDRIPQAGRLMQWSINLGVCSFPWNPRFKQTIRGFTAHILGFRQWYIYQLLILLLRFVCLSIAQYSSSKGLPAPTQLSAQLVIAILMVYVYRVAGQSIHTDTTPLFRPKTKKSSTQKSPSRPAAHQDPNDLGNILDDILQSPSQQHNDFGDSPTATHDYQTNVADRGLLDDSYGRHANSRPPAFSFGSLNLSDSAVARRPEPQITHYDEEMDWSPSASQHRAFSSYNPYKVRNTNPRFSDTPIEPKSGPIWYKVPPAPTNPAHRLRNPPMRPIIRESPKEKKENFFQSTSRGPVDIGFRSQAQPSDLNLAEPKFHAPAPKDDPRDGLSNMFASSFSISPSPDDDDNSSCFWALLADGFLPWA